MKTRFLNLLLTGAIVSSVMLGSCSKDDDKITDQPNTLTDSRDGKIYKTVTIGSQTWMAENLAYLPSVSPANSGSTTDPNYYVYGYQGESVSEAKATANYGTYGVLYNWEAAKAACPSGWHLPSDDEWKELEMAIGMSQSEADASMQRGTNEGTKLKATTGWNNNGNGTDDYGFSALPGGTLNLESGSFVGIGTGCGYWSATEFDYQLTYYRGMYDDATTVERGATSTGLGLSVRCIRD
jgi:uncharacterized protein (TIGR02145 family)